MDFDFSIEFESLLKEWFLYKKERNENYKSSKSRQRFYNMLLKYSGNNIDRATEIIDKSMSNNWAGIFELKNDSNIIPVKIFDKQFDYMEEMMK